jgi:hypothetical protein
MIWIPTRTAEGTNPTDWETSSTSQSKHCISCAETKYVLWTGRHYGDRWRENFPKQSTFRASVPAREVSANSPDTMRRGERLMLHKRVLSIVPQTLQQHRLGGKHGDPPAKAMVVSSVLVPFWGTTQRA